MTFSETENRLSQPLQAAEILGERYEIVRLLGMGAMGCVYLVNDIESEGAQKAIKVLNESAFKEQNARIRFLREADLSRKVQHENVIRVFESGEDRGLLYYVMEYVDAKPLHETSIFQQYDEQEFLKISAQICSGLAAIHDAGITHRDLKPDNILITSDGEIRISDFGVARPQVSNITAHDSIVGTIEYIAPEYWTQGQITQSLDLYALGVVMYEMVTGSYPYLASNPIALMQCHKKSKPIAARKQNPQVARWIDTLISSLLARDPKARPESARDVRETLTTGDKKGSSSGVLIALTELMMINS